MTVHHPLFQNGLGAIRVGVEDFSHGSPERLASAIRSLAAGLLLICKEKLRRLSSEDEVLIWKNLKPVPRLGGGVGFEKVGEKTVDVQDLTERFAAFNVKCDIELLRRVTKVRNSVEHHYTNDVTLVRGAFVDGLRFLSGFLPEHLGISPREVLGADTWEALVQQKEIEDGLRRECRNSYARAAWPSLLKDIIESVGCPKCGSPLVRQADSSNADPFSAVWECLACGSEEAAEDWTEKAVAEYFAGEAYIAVKDGGDPPVDSCPECGKEAFVLEVASCLACGFKWEDAGECAVCGEPLALEDYGEDLCSYHRYVADRERDA